MIERRNSPELFVPPGYSHVVIAAGSRIVAPAGAVPLDPDGNLVGEGDYAAQTRQVIRNLEAALREGGATLRDVIKTTVYYVVPPDRSANVEVWNVVQESGISDAASTLLGISQLGYDGQLVEIEATAVIA